ncbi:MAG: hypothetical protein CSA81_03555 [Acidobacteria bacterium]|nr:MAG: hypothetical protein CSA81_03555 [Acidobacteriota bacterium]
MAEKKNLNFIRHKLLNDGHFVLEQSSVDHESAVVSLRENHIPDCPFPFTLPSFIGAIISHWS